MGRVKVAAIGLLSCMVLLFCTQPTWATGIPEDMKAFENGREAYLTGDFEEAMVFYLKIKHPNSEVLYQTGLVYQGMLNYQAAKQKFNMAVKLDDTHALAWSHLGEILYRDHNYRLAESALTHALKYRRTAYAHYIIGLVFIELKDYAEALDNLNTSYALRPSYKQKSIYSIGLIHSENNHQKLAKKAFNEAIDIAPDSYVGVVADMALKALSRPKPRKWHVNINYSANYDDNVILKPDEKNPQLQSIAQGDFMHALSLYGTYQMIEKGKFKFSANASFYKTMHQNLTFMDADLLSAWVTPSYSTAFGLLAVDLRSDTSWVNGKRYMEGYAVFPRFSFKISKSQSGAFRASYQRQRYITTELGAENRDSNYYSVGYSHNIYFANQVSLSASYGYNAANSKGANWDLSGHYISGSANYPLSKKLSMQVGTSYSINRYRNTHSTAGLKRLSKGLGFSSSLSYQLKSINVQLQYTHFRSKDNVSVYQYRRNTTGLNFNYSY